MIRIKTITTSLALSFLILSQLTSINAAENWPQFRGAGSRGLAESKGPERWSETENVAWKCEVPGRGWSSPIVWGDRVFLTSVVNSDKTEEARKGLYFGGNRFKSPTSQHEWLVLCLDAKTGKTIWQKEVHKAVPKWSLHIKNTYASETPITDGERLYVYFGNLGLYCFDLDGKQLWSREIPAKKTRFAWGTAASPALHGDRLYIVNDNEEQSYLEAIDKRTGTTIWSVDRDEKSNWATPFVWDNGQRTEIVTPGTGKSRVYNLEGKQLYEFGGLSSITIATPYTAHGLLYVTSGYILDPKKPIFAIRPGAAGDISLDKGETSSKHIAWCQKQAAPYNPSTIVYGDLLYVLLDRGFFACYEAKTGKEVYSRKRLPNGRAFTSSPWAYDGKIFCLNEYGETFVIQAGRDFKVLHTNSLADEDMCMATPAIAGGKLFVRTDTRLYCIK